MATREAELYKDKIEVVLDGRQIFYLFFGGAVIACLVFILGVTVGRRVEARESPPRAAAIADPLAALDELDAEGGGAMAFPAALRGDGDKALGEVDARITRPAPPAPAPAAPPASASASASAPAPAKVDGEAAKPTPTPAPAAKPEPAAAPAKGSYTLQLSSFQDRAEAEAFMAGIKQAGLAPYIVQAEVEGKGTWYRIRVGDYPSYDAAVAAKADFEAKQKIIAYVTRLK